MTPGESNAQIERSTERVTAMLSAVLDCTAGNREVRVTDLSLGGCYVDSVIAPLPEEALGLRFVLPKTEAVEISSKVVYVHEGIGFGVRFNEMNPEQRAIVEHLLLLHGANLGS